MNQNRDFEPEFYCSSPSSLCGIGPDARDAVPALIAWARANPDRGVDAALVFAAIGPDAREAVSMLIQLAKNPPAVPSWSRSTALSALAAIGPDAGAALPTL